MNQDDQSNTLISSIEANVRHKSEEIVAKYPNMFTEDKDWWIDTLTDFFNPKTEFQHLSSCAVYNEPAYPKGKCDCGYLCGGECQHYLDILAQIKNHVLVKFESDDEERIKFAREWAKNTAPKHVKTYVDFEMVPHE